MFIDFELSDEQYGHAVAIERLVPSLSYLRTELCSTNMSEASFWKIYFVLLHSKLSKQDAEILSTPQVYSLSSVLFFFLIVFFYHVVSCCSCGLQLPKQKHLLIGLIWTTYIDLVRNKKNLFMCYDLWYFECEICYLETIFLPHPNKLSFCLFGLLSILSLKYDPVHL